MKFQLHSMSISNNKLEVQKANIPSLREREREREGGGGREENNGSYEVDYHGKRN